MRATHRLAISESRGEAHGLAAAARAKGFSLRELASRVGCSHALLSQIGHGKGAITPRIREALRREIGWPQD